VAEREWWETFFEGGWAGIHAGVIPPEETAEHVESIVRLLALRPGERLLDVPCGDGRVALPLAGRGIRVTGVELNDRLLDYARVRAGEEGLDVELRLGDMRELPWRGEFDAALCFSGSFGYFDDEGNAAFVRAVHGALAAGGRFLIDTHIAETVLRIFEERGWERIDETLVLQERRYDHESSRVDVDWTFVRNGEAVTNASSVRLYTYRQLTELLRQAGFARVEAFGPDGEPFRVPGSRRLRVVATA
jgi:SAM-dependent methyltransferase